MRTLIWFVYFWGYLLLHLPAMYKGLKAMKAGDSESMDAIAYDHVPRWCAKLIQLAGVEITVTGRENLPEKPCVFIANHRSLWDIPLMLTFTGKPIPLVAKIESMKWPLIRRWMQLLHCLFLDRQDPRQGLQVMNEAAELVEKGYSVGIFPEGTRYKGEEGGMGPFLGGAFRIAGKSKAPIVPVVIYNSRACLEGDGHWTMKPAKVAVKILPPIETEGMGRTELKALPGITEQMIRDALAKGPDAE